MCCSHHLGSRAFSPQWLVEAGSVAFTLVESLSLWVAVSFVPWWFVLWWQVTMYLSHFCPVGQLNIVYLMESHTLFILSNSGSTSFSFSTCWIGRWHGTWVQPGDSGVYHQSPREVLSFSSQSLPLYGFGSCFCCISSGLIAVQFFRYS